MKCAIGETKTSYSIFIENKSGRFDWFIINKDRCADSDISKERVRSIIMENGNGWIEKAINL